MKIRFLGTGAADWDISQHTAGIDFRRYSSAVVDDTLLIDPGPCVYEFAETFGYDLSGIKYVVNTHSHSDHYNQGTLDRLTAAGAVFFPFKAGESARVGAYDIEAVHANHGTCRDAVHFLISDGDKRLFYGIDGAWLLYDEVQAIKKAHVDLAVLDATIGDARGDYRIFEHNNLRMVEEMKLTLEGDVGRFVITHMARTLHTDHETLVKRMAPSGIEVARDNLELIL